MKAVVLCGGKGTRLRPYTHSVPKPMLLLGRKPILKYIVDFLRDEGVSEIIMTVGHMKNQIIDYFKDGSEHGVKITYSVEEGELGTAGSVKNTLDKLEGEENFLVLMGDQLTGIKLNDVMDFHKKNNADATVALKRNGIPFQYGTVEIDKSNKITGFEEKPIIQKLISVGIYAFRFKAAKKFLPNKGDFAVNVFPKMMKEKQKLLGFVFDESWIDVGSLQDYEHVNDLVSIVDLIASHK
ncbi:MAG: NDP-sugar synthase [Candidatus Micrarchaeia archaeon]